MDITITGRGVGIPDRFEDYATEKAEKVGQLAEKALALEIKLVRHHETNGSSGDDRVELTLIGPGPVVRAEAGAADKYAAFDMALDKMIERIRQAKDRKKVHRGQHRPVSLRRGDLERPRPGCRAGQRRRHRRRLDRFDPGARRRRPRRPSGRPSSSARRSSPASA